MKQILSVFVGTYTQPIRFGTGQILNGKGKGIYCYDFELSNGKLHERFVTENVDNPSYLAFSSDMRFLYAVNELKRFEEKDSGAVSAFSIQKSLSGLTFLNKQATMGTDPCHVILNSAQSHVFVSNFMSGSVSVFPVGPDGFLGEASCFVQHEGSSMNPKRQTGPHAHSLVFSPDERFAFVPDLGIDRLMTYIPDMQAGTLMPAPVPWYTAEPGAGPRHCVFHPYKSICYLINELGSSISVLKYQASAGSFECLQTVPSVLVPVTPDTNICACVKVTPDGRFLYGSNRGQDSIVIYGIEQDGTLAYIDTAPCGGQTPRDFDIDPTGRFLICGNQDSDNIVVFEIDPYNGDLSLVFECKAYTPVCIKPVWIRL